MKNFLFIFSLLLLSEIAYCDVVPENTHKVYKRVNIINIDDFPEYCLLAYIESPLNGQSNYAYKINSMLGLFIGYKFDRLNIIAVKKDYLASKSIEKTNWLEDKNTLKANIFIDCYDRYESNDNPIYSIDEYYKIAEFTDTSVILYKFKELLIYNNGQPASLKTYKYLAGKTQLYDVEYFDLTSEKTYLPDKYSFSLSFFEALFYTILVETIALFIIFKTRLRKFQIKNGTLLLTGIITSLSTLPYVWFVLPDLIKPVVLYIVASELSVIFVESFIIWKLLTIDYKKAIAVSFICNLASFLIGLIIKWI